MNLKIRSALLFSFFVFIILMSAAVFIFLLNDDFRLDDFNKRLKSQAVEDFKQFIIQRQNHASLSYELQVSNVNSLPKKRVAIYNSQSAIIYSYPGDFGPPLTTGIIENVNSNAGEFYYSQKGSDYLVLQRENEGSKYYVVLAATDIYGKRKIDNLKLILGFTIVGGLLLSGLLAFFYVRQIVRPLGKLQMQMQRIDERNLTERVTVSKSKDEVAMIAKNFNSMLDRLEHAFEMRKSFVQHASHELRTPLATMLSQTEAALHEPLTVPQYQKILLSLKEDQQDMIELTNSLLLLSRYEKLPKVKEWSEIRIDEMIYDSIETIKAFNPHATVTVDFLNVPDDEHSLVLKGNEPLIKSAIQNLLRNASQYSFDAKVQIKLLAVEEGITVIFENRGKQLMQEEQEKLFIPFFRGQNSNYKKGYGLGLSIVYRIITLHGGNISYEARDPDINSFTVFFPGNGVYET